MLFVGHLSSVVKHPVLAAGPGVYLVGPPPEPPEVPWCLSRPPGILPNTSSILGKGYDSQGSPSGAGAGIAEELLGAGVDLLVTGDMGIANTTPAACLIAAFTGRRPDEVTGRGTGIDDARWELKVKVVDRALALHAPDPSDPIGVLAAIGGLEHAALVGLILAGAAARIPVILDGVNANASALGAAAIAPLATGYVIAGHRSVEPGATVALTALDLDPLLDLSMRLGEGTGALLAVPIVRAAAAVLSDMATFEEAGIPA